MPQSRKLAAIMFTDVVGYTALMGEDEEAAFALLEKNRELHKPIIEKYGGILLKEMGDGILASFSSAADAVFCALNILENSQNHEELLLRIGIHLGDVVYQNEDIFGDGVNIASRIQELASPGDLLISEPVNQNISNKNGIATEFVGQKQLKGLKDPLKVYRVRVKGFVDPRQDDKESGPHFTKTLWLSAAILLISLVGYFMFRGNSKPAIENDSKTDREKWIAVLPFVDMSAEQDQEYLGDGIAEELISRFAKAKDLKVIARTSSFQFKGENLDIREVGSKLNVNYLVEGSVRKYKDQLRITVQLINAKDGSHLWSEDFDRPFSEILAIQSEISQAVFNQLSSTLGLNNFKNEINAEAYDLYLKAMYMYKRIINRPRPGTLDVFKATEKLFLQAISLDSTFVDAYAALSDLYDFGTLRYPDSTMFESRAKIYAEAAFSRDPESSYSNIVKGNVLLREGKLVESFRYHLKAANINPSNSNAYFKLSLLLHLFGLHKESLKAAKKRLEIDPLDYTHWHYYGYLSTHLGLFGEAKRAYEESIILGGNDITNLFLISCLSRDIKEAKQYLADSSSMWMEHQFIEALWLAANGDPNALKSDDHNGLKSSVHRDPKNVNATIRTLVRLLLNDPDENWSDYFTKMEEIQNAPSKCCGPLGISLVMDSELSVDREFVSLMQPIINDIKYPLSIKSFKECQERNRKKLEDDLVLLTQLLKTRITE